MVRVTIAGKSTIDDIANKIAHVISDMGIQVHEKAIIHDICKKDIESSYLIVRSKKHELAEMLAIKLNDELGLLVEIEFIKTLPAKT